MIITIDGPASVGKGTLARRIAGFYGFLHFDTGMIYRAVGIEFLINNTDINNIELAETYAKELTFYKMTELSKHPEFRGAQGGKNASIVASYPKVREVLLKMQRDFVHNTRSGIVLDGRDTGTGVVPNADLKFFVTASDKIRAERRYNEFKEKGIDVSYEQVFNDIIDRDKKDTNRTVAPLKPAEDAIIIDTSYLNADEAFEKTKKIVDRYLAVRHIF
jgi:cytidylate kinase